MKKIVCLGDSLTYGYMLEREESFPYILGEISSYKVLNKGINGDTSLGMLTRLKSDVFEENPNILILLGGVNDFYANISTEEVSNNIKTIIVHTLDKKIKPIILISLPVEELSQNEIIINSKLEGLYKDLLGYKKFFNFTLISLYEIFKKKEDTAKYYLDGLHLNKKGNMLIAESILEKLSLKK